MSRGVVLAFIAAGAGALLLWKPGAGDPARLRPAPASASAAPGDSSLAQAELDRMRAGLARPERRIAELELAASRPSAAEPAAADDPSGVAPGRAEPTDRDQHQFVARAFDTEADDPDWTAEADIQAELQSQLPEGPSVRSVVCRTTLCRVETRHPDQDAQRAYVNALGMPRPGPPRPFKGALFDQGDPVPGGAGELSSVTYLVRRGHAFPTPEGAAPEAADLR